MQASGRESSSFYQVTPSSHDAQPQPTPCSLGLPSAPSPVHGELGHKGDIMGLGGRWLMGQESNMHTVHSELLLTEFKAGVFLVQLRQGPLQLKGSRGGGPGLGQNKSPDQASSHRSRGRQSLWQGKAAASHLLSFRWGWAGTPEELSPQQVPIVLQEGQVEVTEEFHVLVLHA